ncbi:MAG: hypothetical protein JSR58_00655 [Verrucomicrobia bacterium]|nr:hypothetical protein [Verrucomicrobiota bacterium]
MNFTREPIIETIITPKEGCKLCVRSSKSEGQEEFTVDAVEVVSFGQALFFRSLERPRPFLVPVGDYEVLEVKETRVVLKNASFDRTIKIGGGREAPVRREEREEEASEVSEEAPAEGQQERRHGRRRHRRRRSHEERQQLQEHVSQQTAEAPAEEAAPSVERAPEAQEPAPESTNIFGHLIPPPTSLISEKFHRKHSEQAPQDEPAPEEKNEEGEGEASPLNRVAAETTSFSTGWTHFIP